MGAVTCPVSNAQRPSKSKYAAKRYIYIGIAWDVWPRGRPLSHNCVVQIHTPKATRSFGLHVRVLDFGSEDDVPELAGDAEAVLVVEKVVLQMILLELLVP